METLKLKLVKTRSYELKPFGQFKLKWCPSKAVNAKPDNIDVSEISWQYEKGFPYTKGDEDAFCKYMIKHKTDILVDDRNRFYTRLSESFAEITHPKLNNYIAFLACWGVEDSLEAWNDYLQK